MGEKLWKGLKKNKWEAGVFLGIILIALFLRFYKIDQYMTFLGDEGRDAQIVKGILVNHHIPLLGPPTSIGNMYLGPLYYYMMAVAMGIFWLNPVAAAGMDVLIGVATIVLIYYFSRKWFGRAAAVCATILYSISPITIFYSRSSWNPNPAPFFALLSLLGLLRTRESKNFYWFVLSGAGLAFALQMHYLASILLLIFLILWIYELWKNKKNYENFWKGTIGALLIFLFLMSPLFIFDVRHNFMNFHAISTFFLNRQTTVNLNILNSAARTVPVYSYSLIDRYMTGDNRVLNIATDIAVILPCLYLIFDSLKKRLINWPILSLTIWLVIGVLGLSLYKQTLYDHYLGFLNSDPYILLGSLIFLIEFLKNKILKIAGRVLIGILVSALIVSNLSRLPLLSPPNNELNKTQEVAHYIISLSGGKPYNFALISAHNYDAAYQYYLDIFNDKPAVLPFIKTAQLLVVCEDSVCQPTVNPKEEIAGFGESKIAFETNYDGVKIYKLVANPGGKPH